MVQAETRNVQLWLEEHDQQSIAFDTIADGPVQLGVRVIKNPENGRHNVVILTDSEQVEVWRGVYPEIIFIFVIRAWRSRYDGTVKFQALTYPRGQSGGDKRARVVLPSGKVVAPAVEA